MQPKHREKTMSEKIEEMTVELECEAAEKKERTAWQESHRKIRRAKLGAARKIMEILIDRKLVGLVDTYEVRGLQNDILDSVGTLL